MLIPEIDDSKTIRTLDIITVILTLETVAPGPEVVPSPVHPTSAHSNSRALSSTSFTRTGNNRQSHTVSNPKSSPKNATRTPTPFPALSALGSPGIITKTSTIFRSTTSATVYNSSNHWISWTLAIQPTARSGNTMETMDHAYESRILPLIIAIPLLVSISLIALNIYYFRRLGRRRLRAMLLPRVTGDYEDLNGQNETRPSPRFRVLEPFNISRIVFRAEASSRNMNSRRGALFNKPRQTPKVLPILVGIRGGQSLKAAGSSMEQSDAPPVRWDDEIFIGPSNPRRRSSLLEQVEALQERLRAVEDTMNLGHGLPEVTVPPPEYTPNTR